MLDSYVKGFFSGQSSNSDIGIGVYANISEYKNIRSGSYYKLAKKYYSGTADANTAHKAAERKSRMEYDYKRGDYKVNLESISTSEEKTSTVAGIKEDTDKLKDSLKALNSQEKNSLISGADMDADKIYSGISKFVSDYNQVISDASESESSLIKGNVNSMRNTTMVNSKLLAKIGVSIDAQGRLSVNESQFKASDMNVVKSLFGGNGSYGYQMNVEASMLASSAQAEADKSNTYGVNGTYSYNYSAGDMINFGV